MEDVFTQGAAARARRERQRATAMQPKCRCGNCAPLGDHLCRRCREEADASALAESTVRAAVRELASLLGAGDARNAASIAEAVSALIDAKLAEVSRA